MTAERVSYETEMNPTITELEYRAFQQAYNFFNASCSAIPCPTFW